MAIAAIKGPSSFVCIITAFLISHIPVSSTNSTSILESSTEIYNAESISSFTSQPDFKTNIINQSSNVSPQPTSTSAFPDEATTMPIIPTLTTMTNSSIMGNIQSSGLSETDIISVTNTAIASTAAMSFTPESSYNQILSSETTVILSSSDNIMITDINTVSSTPDHSASDGISLTNTLPMSSTSFNQEISTPSLSIDGTTSVVVDNTTPTSKPIDSSASNIQDTESILLVSSSEIIPLVSVSPSETDAVVPSSIVTGPVDSQISMAPTQTEMISSSATDILPTSSSMMYSSELTSSSIVITTPVPPTTTPAPSTTTTPAPTTTDSNRIQVSADENTVYKIDTVFTIGSCQIEKGNFSSNALLRSYILDQLKSVEEVRNVIVIYNPCHKSRISKRNVERDVEVTFEIEAQANSTKVADDIIEAIDLDKNLNFTEGANFMGAVSLAFTNICNSTICDGYTGYVCEIKSSTEAECVSRCFNERCSDHGDCKTVIVDSNSFGTQCVCHSEEYYKYEGNKCETKRMKWELAVAIAAGSGGAVILILLFILIVCCCCKNRGEKYEYRRQSYEQMSEVLGRPGPQYYRSEGVKSHQPGFTNFGYDDDKYSDLSEQQLRSTNEQSWNPEDSKDTYAKISQQFDQGNNFQIKRPQLSTKRESEPGEATTGF